jgi:hypothetical protein
MIENLYSKEQFLRQGFASALQAIDPAAQPLFGKMNPQQMAEHMAEYIRLGYGSPVITDIFYTEDTLERVRNFIMSDKPFKDNTPNPMMDTIPRPCRHADYAAAVADVEQAVSEMFHAFEQNSALMVASAFFGWLDYPMTIQLLDKHARHHLRQFGVAAA